ncbi:hypothetical protein M569_09955 [Genlisea aurea]|uniref:BED-type domain-containing protein n=1 Tax=Genlisea aurea TaxID=192259 RepID=S8CCY9_9LAMI|nr:hypothetical protein M569_09955 [Genlisea aurea]
MVQPIDQGDSPNSDAQPSKRRKKSMVWDHFTTETVGKNDVRATCNGCKKSFSYISGAKQAGTSHLKRHIKLGICPAVRDTPVNKQQQQLITYSSAPKADISLDGNLTRKRYRAANGVTTSLHLPGSNNKLSQNLARMIVLHDYPIHMVEQSGFRDFVRTLKPDFSLTSSDRVQQQVMVIYHRERQKLLNAMKSMLGHLSLTLDLWTSNQGVSYVLVTGHFVNEEWKLLRRTLNFIAIESPESDTALSRAVAKSLSDWKSEEKLLSVSLDSCSSNENAVENIRSILSIKNSAILCGQLLLKDCYACMLRDLALESLDYIRGTVEKVRYGVKYVKSSKVNEERFASLKRKLQLPSCIRNIEFDDHAKWDTTYFMLSAACELREAFSCLDTYEDADYRSNISVEEWNEAQTVCGYLKTFHSAAAILTASPGNHHPTANAFFLEVLNIYYVLMNAAAKTDRFVSNLNAVLQERFLKYWNDCNQVLAVAVTMDPRFKMKLVEFNFQRIFGDDSSLWIKAVSEGLHELSVEYVVQSLPLTFIQKEGSDPPHPKTEDDGEDEEEEEEEFGGIDVYVSDIPVEHNFKTEELDHYLEDGVLPRIQDFDVLGWWKGKASRYPTLSKLAVDVLSIPVSTVFGESVFDTGRRRRQLDAYRSGLGASTVQALVCAKDWLLQNDGDRTSDVPYRISSGEAAVERRP